MQIRFLIFIHAIIIFLTVLTTAVQLPVENLSQKKSVIILYYFYNGGLRCESCLKMEKVAGQVLKEAFAKEMDAGMVIWKPLDKEMPESAHYRNDFNVRYNTLILSEEKTGKIIRWKNLRAAWDLVWKEKELIKYLQDELRSYLNTK
jgi:uncharacterized membrane protein